MDEICISDTLGTLNDTLNEILCNLDDNALDKLSIHLPKEMIFGNRL